MFPLLSKRITAFFCAVLVLAPVFFLLPFAPKTGVLVAHATVTNLDENGPDAATCKDFGDWKGCVANVAYTLIVGIPRWILGLVGIVFDVVLAVTLSSNIINNQDFVAKGWVVLRDISNTFFIFVLLYIAISTILQTAGGQTKKLLATLIMVALFMNFSLYATKFVIDVSNVFALEFYKHISAGPLEKVKITNLDINPPLSVSAGIINAISFQKLLGNDFVANPNTSLSFKIFIFVMVGIMTMIICFTLLSASILFFARVVALWLLMMLSSLAFFSMILPYTRGKVWTKWSSELVSQAFFAPIFLFFLYFTLILAQTLRSNPMFADGTPGSDVHSGSDVIAVIVVFLNFFAIITVLLVGLKTAKGMSGALGAAMGDIGKRASGYGKFAVGVGAGAALGAVAGVGRLYGKWQRNRMQERDAEGNTLEDRMKADQSILGRGRLALANLQTKGSWDIRNIPGIGKGLTKAAGMAGVDIGLTQGFGKGGASAAFEEKVKEHEAVFNSIQDPKLKAEYLASLGKGKDASEADNIAFRLYSKAPANDRAEIAAKAATGHTAMFGRFAENLRGKELGETHKAALANIKDVRDPRTGAVTKSKHVARAEYLHQLEDFGMSGLTAGTAAYDTQKAKNRNAQREALESMSADDVSDMVSAAQSNPRQAAMLNRAIARTVPEKQVSIHQAILRDVKEKIDPATGKPMIDPVTGKPMTSAFQRAAIISAVPDAEVRKTLWEKESAEMRAEILAENPGLQPIEDTLSEDKREQTRTAKKRVNRRLTVAAKKKDIQAVIGAAPAGAPLPPASITAIHAAMEDLDDNQIASLGPDILNRKEVRDKFKVTTLAAIAAYEEVDKSELKVMLKEYVDRIIPLGNIPYLPGTPGAKRARESMRQLFKNKPLFNLLDSADQVNVEEQADIRS